MQRATSDETHLSKTVLPFESIRKSRTIDSTVSEFDNANKKVQKTKRMFKKAKYNKDIPG